MRIALVLLLVVPLAAGCCCRRTCCPAPGAAPVVSAARAVQPTANAATLPAGTLEATLLYGRGSAAARTNPDAARLAWAQALSVLGTEPGPERLEAFRARIRARLAAPGDVSRPAADQGLVVQIQNVADLVEIMGRLPFPRVELVGPDGVRGEEPIGVLGGAVLEYLPPQPAAPVAPVIRPQGGQNLVVKASPAQQDDVGALLTAWRDVWPLLWPAHGS